MAIEYWLISGKTKLRLPVNPESYAYSSPFAYTETEVEGLGEVTNIGYRGLKEFSIATFWPKDYNATYCSYSGFISPSSFVSTIEKWRSKREPIRYVVTGVKGANTLVTIRDFEVEAEKAGAPGDIYFTLTLKEYREPTVKVIDTSKPKFTKQSKSRPPAQKPTQLKTYTVKSGDCLWKIAADSKVYGDGNKWRKIYDANKKTIGKNPNRIYPGQKLVIPK
ncbi:LysM peptidoglycan-binding domain-containing protein [Neobacillus niacini]|uniref:LysM peptidoglycan-binding domain-containing protein n=1 Tax=Neobacillus niacini TaxID=86668 RepID=UPI0028593CD5|nr:LysM peptidoglycan-binding domain-containing protein [Neobacillus niacini]MDR7001557.1 LysM repeat protein [Neobacillus niacini]